MPTHQDVTIYEMSTATSPFEPSIAIAMLIDVRDDLIDNVTGL